MKIWIFLQVFILVQVCASVDLVCGGFVRQIDSNSDPSASSNSSSILSKQHDSPATTTTTSVVPEVDLLEGFHMYLSRNFDENIEIWSDGILKRPMRRCSESVESGTGNQTDCLIIEENVEDIHGLFYVDYPMSQYAFRSLDTKAVAKDPLLVPVVEDYYLDVENMEGEFTVTFACVKELAGNSIPVQISFKITNSTTVHLWVIKKCGGGELKDVTLGFVNRYGEMVPFSASTQLKVNPLTTSTSVYAALHKSTSEIRFKTPIVQSSAPEIVEMEVRGAALGGVLSNELTMIEIQYSCKSRGVATVSLVLEIPPYDNLEASWKKDCGGTENELLRVGTQPMSGDVVENGRTTQVFALSYAGMTEDDSSRYIIPANRTSVTFYFHNSLDVFGDGVDMNIGTISITRGKPFVLSALVSPPPLFGSAYLGPTGGMLNAGETKHLEIKFVCKRVGTSKVLITLPTLNFRNIEFGFVKECRNPRKVHESSFLQTANSFLLVMVLGSALSVALLIYAWRTWKQKRLDQSRFVAVPFSTLD